MMIPNEFIGCRVKGNDEKFSDYGETLGRIVSWYSNASDVNILLITNEGTFRNVAAKYVKILKEDMAQMRSCLTIEKSDRFELMDL